MNFIKRVQNTPKVKRIRTKIKKNEMARRKLSNEYKRAIKSESKRLSKGKLTGRKKSKRRSTKTRSRSRR